MTSGFLLGMGKNFFMLIKSGCAQYPLLVPGLTDIIYNLYLWEVWVIDGFIYSPIMEASLEDTRSSGSSVSGGSLSSVTQTSAIKYLHISDKLELGQSLPAEVVTDSGGGNVTGQY